MSLYEDLGVPADATTDQINAAYRRAAKKHHPDAGGEPEAFARVQRAVAILRDPGKRVRYDADGTVDDGAGDPPDPALAILATAFAAILGELDELAAVDVVASLRRRLKYEQKTVAMALAMAGRELRRATDALGRLTHKGGARPNVLATMLGQQCTAIERQQQLLTERKAAIAAAIEMAADYTWRTDPAQPEKRRDEVIWPDFMPPSGRKPRFRLDDL